MVATSPPEDITFTRFRILTDVVFMCDIAELLLQLVEVDC